MKELRPEWAAQAQHPQTTDIIVKLAVAFNFFLEFALEKGAITQAEKNSLWDGCCESLLEVAKAQACIQDDNDPVELFLELLRAVLATGRAYVSGGNGEAPDEAPEAWGWEQGTTTVKNGTEDKEITFWKRRSTTHLGWRQGDDLYLQAKAAFAAVQKLARETDLVIPVTERTLGKLLHECGLLKSREEDRGRYTTRRNPQGSRKNVLHLNANVVVEPPYFKSEGPEDFSGLDSLTNGQ